MPNEITKSDFDIYINVSDEYIPDCATAARAGKLYFWFPMNECCGDMGLNSLYGALQILWIAEEENKKVYLHCHAGANRSPTVADAYFFLRTKKHRGRKAMDDITVNYGMTAAEEYQSNNNRLLDNIESGFLPAKKIMERFLSKCETAFKVLEYKCLKI
jgi:hypothetical protein